MRRGSPQRQPAPAPPPHPARSRAGKPWRISHGMLWPSFPAAACRIRCYPCPRTGVTHVPGLDTQEESCAKPRTYAERLLPRWGRLLPPVEGGSGGSHGRGRDSSPARHDTTSARCCKCSGGSGQESRLRAPRRFPLSHSDSRQFWQKWRCLPPSKCLYRQRGFRSPRPPSTPRPPRSPARRPGPVPPRAEDADVVGHHAAPPRAALRPLQSTPPR